MFPPVARGESHGGLLKNRCRKRCRELACKDSLGDGSDERG